MFAMPWKVFSTSALVLGTLFCCLMIGVARYPVIPLEVTIARWFQMNQRPWLVGAMGIISFLAVQGAVIGVVLVGASFWKLRWQLEAWLVVGTYVSSMVVCIALKTLINRPRPTDLLPGGMGWEGGSFPSANVVSCLAFWGVLCAIPLRSQRNCWWHAALLVLASLLIVLSGPARVYVGEHWISDIVGGYVFGGLMLALCVRWYRKAKARTDRRDAVSGA